MRAEPRVAFFTDSFLEVNGVAHTSRQLAAYAKRRVASLLVAHAAPETQTIREGSLVRLALKRGRAGFGLDAGLRFDPLLWRYARPAVNAVREFNAGAVHVTGPSDIGQLGAYVAHRLNLPLVISWHTNVHEYAYRRLGQITPFLPAKAREALASFAEALSLQALTRFYRLGRVLLAPNEELGEMLERDCRRPVLMMRRGVDTELFSPVKRARRDGVFTLGYVGRLTPEKNVRMLADIERQLVAAGFRDFRFVIVGTGSEREWLEQNLQCTEFTGVLKGEALARAYANFDLFLFPSTTDTFGNVVLEALASGVPAVVSGRGGPKFIIKNGESGIIADDAREFAEAVLTLRSQPELLARMREAARMMIPLSTMQELLGAPGKCSMFLVKCRNTDEQELIAQAIVDRFPDFRVLFTRDLPKLFAEGYSGFNVFLNVVAGLAAAISLLVISLTMYTTVTERTRQIGILKSLGASKPYIAAVFLKESLAISAIGVASGLVIALLVRAAMVHAMGTKLEIETDYVLLAIAGGLASGIAGAVYPALRAASQDPVDALNYERSAASRKI